MDASLGLNVDSGKGTSKFGGYKGKQMAASLGLSADSGKKGKSNWILGLNVDSETGGKVSRIRY